MYIFLFHLLPLCVCVYQIISYTSHDAGCHTHILLFMRFIRSFVNMDWYTQHQITLGTHICNQQISQHLLFWYVCIHTFDTQYACLLVCSLIVLTQLQFGITKLYRYRVSKIILQEQVPIICVFLLIIGLSIIIIDQGTGSTIVLKSDILNCSLTEIDNNYIKTLGQETFVLLILN